MSRCRIVLEPTTTDSPPQEDRPMTRPALAQPIAAVLALFTLAGGAAGAEPSWPSFRGPHGTGQVLEGLPPGDGPLALDLRWKRALGSGYAGISVAEGVLVTAFTAGERDVVAAFDPETGEERWRYDLAPVYRGHDGSHDGPISTPAIAGGRVFALGPRGHLAALDLRTGEAVWTTHLVDDLGCEKPMETLFPLTGETPSPGLAPWQTRRP